MIMEMVGLQRLTPRGTSALSLNYTVLEGAVSLGSRSQMPQYQEYREEENTANTLSYTNDRGISMSCN